MLNLKTLALSATLAASAIAAPLLGVAAHTQAAGVVHVDAGSRYVEISGDGLPAYDGIYVEFTAPDGESFDLTRAVSADRYGSFDTTVSTGQFLSVGAGFWTVDVTDDYGQSTSMTVLID